MSCHRGSYNYSESQNNTGKNNGTKNMQPTRGMANDSSNLPTNGAGNGTLTNTAPMLPLDMQMPSTVSSTYYTAGFLVYSDSFLRTGIRKSPQNFEDFSFTFLLWVTQS